MNTRDDFGDPDEDGDEAIVADLPRLLRERRCQAGEPWTGDDPDAHHGHTDCWFHSLAANEIDRLRADLDDAVTRGDLWHVAEMAADAKARRLETLVRAMADEGWTTWPNTTCGRGGVGGQAITTTIHGDALHVLVEAALRGDSLEDAADNYEAMYPQARRLDVASTRKGYRRAGADGRPL